MGKPEQRSEHQAAALPQLLGARPAQPCKHTGDMLFSVKNWFSKPFFTIGVFSGANVFLVIIPFLFFGTQVLYRSRLSSPGGVLRSEATSQDSLKGLFEACCLTLDRINEEVKH